MAKVLIQKRGSSLATPIDLANWEKFKKQYAQDGYRRLSTEETQKLIEGSGLVKVEIAQVEAPQVETIANELPQEEETEEKEVPKPRPKRTRKKKAEQA